MTEPNPEVIGYKGEPIVRGSETIYEIITAEDGVGYGLALVRIGNKTNEAHYHERTTEMYVALWGSLQMYITHPGEKVNPVVLPETYGMTIRPGDVHRALSVASKSDHSWFYVFTWPPFDPADYHPVE